MRYLSFDIECCDGQHICEFGYVLIDEKFNILERDCITINPEYKFKLTGRERESDISLAFPEDVYYNSPTFDFYYERIKRILTIPDCQIIGFSLSNDAGFLATAYELYEKEPISFTYYDFQKLYQGYTKAKNRMSVEGFVEELQISDITLHKSDDDVNTKIGYTGIAKYLNLQGVTKRPRKESDAKVFSGHFIQILLDNPVYCGKIAYGRRKHERIKGKKNEYHVVHQKEFSLTDGLHEGIVSKELWEKARDKRVATGIKLASKIGKDRTYLLTGILKCPKCGSPMYANRIRWTKKDGTEKEVMYYSCSRNKMKRGGFCDYSANLKKTDIEPLVIGVIKQIINDERFVEGVKSSIGIHVDEDKIVEEIKNYEAKLKEVQLNKNRLETELDTLPIDAKYRDRKIKDMTTRIDSMYDVIAEIEEKIDDARYRKHAIEEKSLTFENIYRILEHFSKIYDIINDEERKELLAELIKEIHIYPEGERDYPLKSIKFAFPILLNGKEVDEIFLNKPSSVETLAVLTKKGNT